MQTAGASKVVESWVELPEPDLGRYLLVSRRRAANDNGRFLRATFPVFQIGACVAFSSTLTLIVALIR